MPQQGDIHLAVLWIDKKSFAAGLLLNTLLVTTRSYFRYGSYCNLSNCSINDFSFWMLLQFRAVIEQVVMHYLSVLIIYCKNCDIVNAIEMIA